MKRSRSLIKPAALASLALSGAMALTVTTFIAAPASALVYCTYVGYPAGCIARAGVVLRPRPVARAAVGANTVNRTNINGGVNRVGVRR
jgi:hypothetical protein